MSHDPDTNHALRTAAQHAMDTLRHQFVIEIEPDEVAQLDKLLAEMRVNYPEMTRESALAILVSIGLDHAKDVPKPSESNAGGLMGGGITWGPNMDAGAKR